MRADRQTDWHMSHVTDSLCGQATSSVTGRQAVMLWRECQQMWVSASVLTVCLSVNHSIQSFSALLNCSAPQHVITAGSIQQPSIHVNLSPARVLHRIWKTTSGISGTGLYGPPEDLPDTQPSVSKHRMVILSSSVTKRTLDASLSTVWQTVIWSDLRDTTAENRVLNDETTHLTNNDTVSSMLEEAANTQPQIHHSFFHFPPSLVYNTVSMFQLQSLVEVWQPLVSLHQLYTQHRCARLTVTYLL